MVLPIDKDYNNVYSFSKLLDTDTDEDRIKQHLYYDYTKVNGFQYLSSYNIEKSINLGVDLELNINYDVDYSDIIKYNYCVVLDKRVGTNNQKKKYFYFISDIRQSNSAGKYKINLKYDYWSNNVANIYLNNFENVFNFVRRTNSPKYFPITNDKLYIEVDSDYKLSSVSSVNPLVSKRITNESITDVEYTLIFAKILLKGLSDKRYYKVAYTYSTGTVYEDFGCSAQYLPTQFVLLPFGVYNTKSKELVKEAKVFVDSGGTSGGYTIFKCNDALKTFLEKTNVNEYISAIELTSIIPFIDSGVINRYDKETDTFYMNNNYYSGGLGTSDNQVIGGNFIFCNYFNLGSCQKSFNFSEGNLSADYNEVPKIIHFNDISNLVIDTNRYPYRYKGVEIGSSKYDFISGHGKADYELIIRGTGVGYTIYYNVKVGNKELNPGRIGNFPAKDIFYLPFYGDNYTSFLLGNSNQLSAASNNSINTSLIKLTLASISATLGTVIAGISPNLAVAGIGAASAGVGVAANAVLDTVNTQYNIESKIEDSRNLLNDLKGNNNGLVSIFTANVPIFFEASEFDKEEINQIAFDIYTKGSKYNGISDLKNIVSKGKYYNYIQTNVDILPFNSVDKNSLAELTKIFNKGVRIWNINEAEYTKGISGEIFIDETFASMNLLIFNYREKEN